MADREPSKDFVMNWPVYINDDDVVTCHVNNCKTDGHMFAFGRRKTVGELLEDIKDHIKEYHINI